VDWAAETIAFMKDPKNAENKDALQLKRYIEMVVETKKFYQQRYSMTEEQAIEKACEDTPIGS